MTDPLEAARRLLAPAYASTVDMWPDVAAVARALLAREEATGWQPIETAPKDDSDFQALGCHQDEDGHSWSYYIINRHDVGGRYECWVVPPGRPINPTHWMPLPAPPALPAKEPT